MMFDIDKNNENRDFFQNVHYFQYPFLISL